MAGIAPCPPHDGLETYVHRDQEVEREIHADDTEAEGHMMEEGKNQHARLQGEPGGTTVWQCDDDAGT